ncbi:MAG: HAD-IG family 5'-nucleotidase [Deltaproteobacteria bacterium]|nr:HAD-IG family 5'-nucleotidase [Deltaproteobacteria bacterium]
MTGLDSLFERAARSREVFCNRTLNLRAVRAIGYDMDYTLVHYHVEAWELRAYEHLKRRLLADHWPVEDYAFDPLLVTRGLIIDTELGNVVKANRFGYVKRAFHGTRPLPFDEQRRVYGRTTVDLADRRWVFLNTLFSLSEGCMYLQLVDLLDARRLPEVMGYARLYRRTHESIDAAHAEGELKAEIMADPDRFVMLDPETPPALLDQKTAGKKLMLITNSEWAYTRSIMAYSFDRYLPKGKTWRDLFDVTLVNARKPDFFLGSNPLFEVVSEEGLLRPARALRDGAVFSGGDAMLVERTLGASGDEILYVGDHMWGDVHVSKSALRWRTALVLRELEAEIVALEAFAPLQARLRDFMAEKERLEFEQCRLRLELQRARGGLTRKGGPPIQEIERGLSERRVRLEELDGLISPLAQASDEVGNQRWGPLLRTGNDKSHLARQVENYADIYTSRVSNLLFRTPFAYLRSAQGNLPHDVAQVIAAAAPS